VSRKPDYARTLGQRLYVAGCARCQGLDGNGEPDTDNPPVARQYPAYLGKQRRGFRTGQPRHGDAVAEELDALLVTCRT